MSEHTRLPWRVGSSRLDGSVNLVEADDGLVAFCDFELGHDAVNAAFIVKAVNAFDGLLEQAAKACYEASRKKVSGRPSWEKLNPNEPYDMGMKQYAYEEALAKAGVTP